jgi:hypothetical protein
MTKRRKREVGTMIYMTTLQANMKDGSTAYYWIEVPEGMTNEQAAETQEWHGPFRTDEEAEEHFRVVICGDIPVIDGGILHPDWETRQ